MSGHLIYSGCQGAPPPQAQLCRQQRGSNGISAQGMRHPRACLVGPPPRQEEQG